MQRKKKEKLERIQKNLSSVMPKGKQKNKRLKKTTLDEIKRDREEMKSDVIFNLNGRKKKW